jgi:hypothetical protein
MPLPLIALGAAALAGRATSKREGKEQFVAVKGKKHKDGTTGKAFVRKRAKSR